jgi:hypothetical protein
MNSLSRKQMPHLFATVIALGLAVIIFFAVQRVLIHLEHATIVSTASENFILKNQGLAFQRAAAHSPNVLLIYGSSELRIPETPERGNIFFRTALTGFQLSPVGGGGANPLTRQKGCLLAFARLVLLSKTRYQRIHREFFADGGDGDCV